MSVSQKALKSKFSCVRGACLQTPYIYWAKRALLRRCMHLSMATVVQPHHFKSDGYSPDGRLIVQFRGKAARVGRPAARLSNSVLASYNIISLALSAHRHTYEWTGSIAAGLDSVKLESGDTSVTLSSEHLDLRHSAGTASYWTTGSAQSTAQV